ncbi:MAG TPA: penicillin acylase family protein, partial [Promineifilum sp.]|nr:penicillin acylase family protein [Promineifilum sp.]
MTSRNPSDRRLPVEWLALPVALAAGALGTAVALRRLMRHPVPPPDGRLSVDGLHAPVEIIRDEWGVPHIYAADAHDLFFAQGFAHAQDRLFQMDLNRRLGLGRLAEVTGPMSLPMDKFARYLGWPRAAQAARRPQLFGSDQRVGGFIASMGLCIRIVGSSMATTEFNRTTTTEGASELT